MSGPQIVIEMDSNEAKLWAGFQRIMRGEEGIEKGMGKVAGETRKAAAEQAALERAAKRTIDSVLTPQERYNQKIAELNTLYSKSLLNVNQFRSALSQLDAQYNTTQGAAEKTHGSMANIGQAGEKTFGAAALASLGAYVTGLVSISAALGLVADGFAAVDVPPSPNLHV